MQMYFFATLVDLFIYIINNISDTAVINSTDPFVSWDSQKTEECSQFIHRYAVASKNTEKIYQQIYNKPATCTTGVTELHQSKRQSSQSEFPCGQKRQLVNLQ